jgi:putative transposase
MLKPTQGEALAFRSDEDKCLARDLLRANIEASAPELKWKAMRTQRRLLHPPEPVLSGDSVGFGHDVPSTRGLAPNDVAVDVAAPARADAGIPEPGPRRGGRKAAAKAAATRARNDAGRSALRVTKTDARPFAPETRDLAVADPDAFMADLARRMGATNTEGGQQ